MTALGCAIAAAASSLEGVPFRLHGRDRATGLDCVGVVAWSLASAGKTFAIPACYSLRNSDIGAMLALADRSDVREVRGAAAPGDILLARPGPAQHHLLVAIDPRNSIHAHAGLRRVVRAPLPSQWPLLRHWRLT